MKELLYFHEIDKTMNAYVGGKGANLGEMTRAGLPVPPGFCLTTRVYNEFSAGLDLEGLNGEEARTLLQNCTLPDSCVDEMHKALKKFPEGTLFSVRSSATAEDLPYASFAGQQDTYLNVKASDLPEAVKKCFVSLYTDRAVSYRQQNGIEKPSMSVVVQQMVCSDASGVMFTVNPVNGNRSHLVIDAVFGLGEAIVSGLVSPDHIIYDRKNRKIVRDEIACKAFAIVSLPNGGTERRQLDSSEPVLTQKQISELAALGEKLEAHYNAPQDVEWALQDGKLYVLQTRAITSLYPVPQVNDNKFHFFYNIGYQQMNTAAMPVMATDCLLGVTNLREEDLLDYQSILIYNFGQHLFVDFSMIFWAKPARAIILKKLLPNIDPLAASAIEELLERKEKLQHPHPDMLRLVRKAVKAFPKFLRSREPKALSLENLDKIEHKIDASITEMQNNRSNPEALRTIFKNSMMFDIFAQDFMPMVMSGVLALKKLEKMEEKMGCKGRWTKDIQIGNEGNIVTEMGLHIGDMADLVAADSELRSLLTENRTDLAELLSVRQDAFGKCYREFMELYGFRGAGELDVSKVRWREDPKPILSQVLAMSKDKAHNSHRLEYEEKNRKAALQGDAMIQAVKEALGKKQASKARKLLEQFRWYYPKREHFKYYWMCKFSVIREMLLEIGDTMVRQGQLDKREDIMHLRMKEAYYALENLTDMRAVVSERSQEFKRISRLSAPRIITSEGEILMGVLSRDGLPENALIGVGVSPGVVEGIAKVVFDPSEAVVEKGEILIAPFTDPGWTPLFVDAAAVVTEIGGALTHGAVVAREYGIPGVVGVVDATKKIKTGQKISVDGTSGYVLILS